MSHLRLLLGYVPWHHRTSVIVLLGTQLIRCLEVRLQDIANDPPIPAHLLGSDLALSAQPADVFGMASGDLCCTCVVIQLGKAIQSLWDSTLSLSADRHASEFN